MDEKVRGRGDMWLKMEDWEVEGDAVNGSVNVGGQTDGGYISERGCTDGTKWLKVSIGVKCCFSWSQTDVNTVEEVVHGGNLNTMQRVWSLLLRGVSLNEVHSLPQGPHVETRDGSQSNETTGGKTHSRILTNNLNVSTAEEPKKKNSNEEPWLCKATVFFFFN